MARRAKRKKTRDSDGSHFICKCECGGQVRGVWEFGRQWSWCETCTPVTTVRVNRSGVPECMAGSPKN